MTPVVVIPAFKPDQHLVDLVKKLNLMNLSIIIVDDGSGQAYTAIFNALSAIDKVKVLHHAVNLGKGQALKTAFNYFLANSPVECTGIVTADADGQHLAQDIYDIAKQLESKADALILGTRHFNKDVPWRSRFGNILTRFVFRLLLKQTLQDTQTGLRGIPRNFLESLLKTSSQGYDFELDMLVCASKQKLPIQESPIHTIYNDKNKNSHFNPLIDSLKIYFIFVRYLAFSLLSGILDFCAFSLGFMLSSHILLSETLARTFSGSCNFLLNKEWVFKSKQKALPEAIKYASLCLVNLAFSYALISSLVFLNINVYLSKILALIGLFIANFAIQRLLVFKDEQTSQMTV